jgi:hypothetical protein
MAAATAIAVFIIPALYVLVERVAKRWSGGEPKPDTVAVPEPSMVEGD